MVTMGTLKDGERYRPGSWCQKMKKGIGCNIPACSPLFSVSSQRDVGDMRAGVPCLTLLRDDGGWFACRLLFCPNSEA